MVVNSGFRVWTWCGTGMDMVTLAGDVWLLFYSWNGMRMGFGYVCRGSEVGELSFLRDPGIVCPSIRPSEYTAAVAIPWG